MTKGTILRGTTAFMTVTETGELNSKGRKVLSIGYRGKRVAQNGIPLASLMVPLMRDMLPHITYDTREQFDADIALLKEYVNGLVFKEDE